MTKEKLRFSIKHLPSLVKQTAISWDKDNPWRLSAVVAYYAILSLPGLLIIIVTMLSYIYRAEVIECFLGRIYMDIYQALGL